ncbi:MAG: aminopeptidase P N-terminal domain-containing protein [Sandaracinus sp.]|nr:aminopeptidase P N-terminal domain-containing protein [Sandaracinus sp.]
MDKKTYAARRARLLEATGPGVVLIPSAPVFTRNNDVEHPYRQDSDFYYLTGFDEPESVLVLSTHHPEHRAVLFVRPRNLEREIWDGPRLGLEGAVSELGVDAAYDIAELDERLPDYLGDVDRVFVRVGRGHPFDTTLFRALDGVRARSRRGIRAPTELVDPVRTLHELRLHKDADEVAAMRRAAEVTRDAHLEAMRVAKPGRREIEVAAEMERIFRLGGSERPAYESIVGSGPNATILHYRAGRRPLGEGELLLIDAGCELDYYASDVTRTFPVSGKFSPEQRALYDVTLASQLACLDATKPGTTLDAIHDVAVDVITRGLIDLGLLQGSVEENVEQQKYRAFYMHRTSHWLGMDVHDVGLYYEGGKPRPLEPGFVLTVEPGIYVAANAEVDPKWRGIGIRIEDDLLVTATGHQNLTHDIPKDADEIERILADR